MVANQQWQIYLPTLLLSVVLMIPGLRHSEQANFTTKLLKLSIACLCLAEIGLWVTQTYLIGTAICLLCFFTAFNLLEAYLPALVSKLAPRTHRGAAIGMFSSCQFLGIFIGGSLGGWLYQHYHAAGIFCFSLISCLCWLIVTLYFTKHQNFLEESN
jgi:predicted MFS family arabinose efflux permease